MRVLRFVRLLWIHIVTGAVVARVLLAGGGQTPAPPVSDVEWPLHGLTDGEARFSPLDEINRQTVDGLGLAWVHEFGSRRGIEATPIVVDGRLFVTGPWSVVHCFDAVSGTPLWSWDPKVDKAVYGRRACCDVVNRGVNHSNGKLFVGVLDGRLAALDARTGKLLWETVTLDQTKNYTITGAPRIAKDKVIIGNGGAEYGVRGYVTAYEMETGKQAWRFYSVPGNPALGFESPAMAEAAKTWKGEWWEAGGGGTCWDSMAYDPELNLLYVGTGNGSPWNRRHRSPGGGDNLYLSSILAINPDTGRLVWHYQTTPGDTWDYTATQHMILADLSVDGIDRKVLMQAPKNGFFYVIDRESGELISAENYTSITWADGVDPNTGRPREIHGADYAEGRAEIKPGPEGGHNWQPMAFNPETGLVYFPVQEFHTAFRHDPDYRYDPATWNLGVQFVGGGVGSPPGSLVAWDPVQQKRVWSVPRSIVWNGGVLTTAGGLVFQGTGTGKLYAHDAKTGETLWEWFTGTAIIAPPMTYRIGGRQYVSVAAGWGGSYGLRRPPGGEAARYEQRGRLFTFVLGGKGAAPDYALRQPRVPTGPEIELEYSREAVSAGARLYRKYCGACHQNGVLVPSLHYTSKETHQLWELIVYDGIYAAAKGMPAFKGMMSREEVRQIQAFVVEASRGMARRLEKK